jgi:hypothetical protein
MLNDGLDQGAGLRMITQQLTPRLLTLASHGDKAGELPFLWSLCSTLSNLGYPLVVLDVTTRETRLNPGLQDCLVDNYSLIEQDANADTWPVLPSSQGFARLCNRKKDTASLFDNLAEYFRNYGVVVLYLPTDILVSHLPDSRIEPLLAVSSNQVSLLTSYQALKKILYMTRLQPTVISVENSTSESAFLDTQVMNKSLQSCVQSFMDRQIETLTLPERHNSVAALDDLNQLALRLLEKAQPLCSLERPQASGGRR